MANHADRNRTDRGPDPVVNSDRGTGTTPPETEPAKTEGHEREPFNEREALKEGGSFDAVAPPGDRPGG